MLRLVHPKMKLDAVGFIFTNWQCYPAMREAIEELFDIKNVLIWEKNAWSRGDTKGNWGYMYEMVIYFRKKIEPKYRRFLNGKREGNILKYKKLPTNYMRHPCLPAGELVFVDGDWQPIERVGVGSQTNYGTIVATSTHEAEAIVTIILEDGSTTRATENHPFLVARDGNVYWIEARHLTTQDEILTIECIHSNLKPVCVKKAQDVSAKADTLELQPEKTVACMPDLSTALSGKERTEGQSPKATKSTIGTTTSKTIVLKTLSLSIPLHTNGITLVQEGYQMDNGKSNVGSVKYGSLSRQSSGTTAEAGQPEDSASLATSRKVSQFGKFSLRRVGSVRTTHGIQRVYNLTIQGIPAFDAQVGVSHNTEKPTALLEYLIEKTTQPGDMVADFFAGSGSTLVAAKNLGRNYLGTEIEKVWYDVARERLDSG